ncbi:hypothetical protein [Cloacibacillus porcorum]|uniref:hypothetical protein n=1 Tax=Cloacibacillus porcorum TaxID=1197717 RepID=UPI00248E62F2|nr:hypothetical protein [Cloacibacillus porcorum]
MKKYKLTEKQLEELKKYVEMLHEIAKELSSDIAFSTPEIYEEQFNEIIDDYLPLFGFECRDEMIAKLNGLCNDAVLDAVNDFDKSVVEALHDRVSELEKDLKYIVEDIESQEVV